MDVLSARLKWLREKEKLNQKEVAEKIGVTVSGYQKMEYGEAKPKIDSFVKICKFYRESSDFLLGLSDQTNDLKIIGEELHYIRKNLHELKTEFISLYFDPQVSKDVKDNLEDRINKLQNEFDSKRTEYVLELLEIPCVKRDRDLFLLEKYPLKIAISYNDDSEVYQVHIIDNNEKVFIFLEEDEEEDIALSMAFGFGQQYNLPVKGWEDS